ncbi:alpha/beta hydrolase [Streptomyces spectabilis]|uniref:Alpha/beta fold hydrolase n=1 Tax=Streptomyces spectabilis TaxID=68270 RepID=A0A5P2XC03_STRST|nr:alpha/beta fold hydrolase [Streptomyces spectabilis]MBB5106822.1 pimeloyl-ACP methyl ester carboxylesterase [Streptomyces spectabilis]MCI3903327.1 alpha/beta hydrolase [Streptomyces spectabilis]QEV60550.1 alpha/beta fold hydrolase [Streptomyces spectabilis]GGV44055.1 thioesterase [Streptomyces spectabilis]
MTGPQPGGVALAPQSPSTAGAPTPTRPPSAARRPAGPAPRPAPPVPLPPWTPSPGVRQVTLAAGDGITLSGLLALPRGERPRATVLALHGAGTSAAYFDGQAHPGTSLLTLAADLGYAVLALDRPGYGLSAARLPQGLPVAEQAATVRAALRGHAALHDTGAGVLVLAHSFGGKVALRMAADDRGDPSDPVLLGLDVSGCGERYARPLAELTGPAGGVRWSGHWGPLRLYPPHTFRASARMVSPVPPRELRDAARWPGAFAALAGRVRVPVRFTFAEYEALWHCDAPALARLRAGLRAAPRVSVDRQPGAGHNISLGWAARAYHLRALAFADDCLRR